MGLTQQQLAQALGITPKWLREQRDRGMPYDLEDPHVIRDCAIWLYCNTNPQAGGWTVKKGEAKSEDVNAQIKLATLRKLEEEAREKRLRNEETEGRLLDAASVEHRINEWVVRIRSHLGSLSTKLVPLIPGDKGKVKAKIDREIRTAMLLLHEEGTAAIDDCPTGDD